MTCNAIGSILGSCCETCVFNVNKLCDCSKQVVIITQNYQPQIGDITQQAQKERDLLKAITKINALPLSFQTDPAEVSISIRSEDPTIKTAIGVALIDISRECLRRLQTQHSLEESYHRLIGAASLSGIDLQKQFADSIGLNREKKQKLLATVEKVNIYGSRAVHAWQLIAEKPLDEIAKENEISTQQFKIIKKAFNDKKIDFYSSIKRNKFTEIPTHSKQVFMKVAEYFPEDIRLSATQNWISDRNPAPPKLLIEAHSLISSSDSLSNARESSNGDSNSSSPRKIEEEFKQLFLAVNGISGKDTTHPKSKLGFLRLQLLCCLLAIDPETLENVKLNPEAIQLLSQAKDRLLSIDGMIVRVYAALQNTNNGIELQNIYGFPSQAIEILSKDKKRYRKLETNLRQARTLSEMPLDDLHLLAQAAECFNDDRKKEFARLYTLDDWLERHPAASRPLRPASPQLEMLDLDCKTP